MVTRNPRLGVDLAGLDLRTTYQGDLALNEGRENVRAAMMRRLDTPVGGLFSHPDYGNPVHDILSDVMDNAWEGKVIAGIHKCLQQEPRIQVQTVEVETELEARKAIILITYSVLNEPGTDNLVWEVNLP